MASVDLRKVNRDHATLTAKAIKANAGKHSDSVLSGIWHWINGVASGAAHLIKSLASLAAIIADDISFLTHCINFILSSLERALNWLRQFVIEPLRQQLTKEIAQLRSRERRDVRYLIRLVYVAARNAMSYAFRLVRHEHSVMVKEVKHAEHLAKLDVRRLHHRIEHEAASGYAIDQKARTGLLIHLLEFLGVHNPAVAPVVADITTGLLDLLAVDDPLLRISLGFLIKHVIDRLGLEKPLGALIEDLMAPILGNPAPRDLHDVIADISKRLSAMEDQWSTFFTDGGSQVEQAGKEWQSITGIAASIAMVAFTAQAVVDPQAWASEIQAVIGRPANDLVTKAAALFRG